METVYLLAKIAALFAVILLPLFKKDKKQINPHTIELSDLVVNEDGYLAKASANEANWHHAH
jgi:hypothetical protein